MSEPASEAGRSDRLTPVPVGDCRPGAGEDPANEYSIAQGPSGELPWRQPVQTTGDSNWAMREEGWQGSRAPEPAQVSLLGVFWSVTLVAMVGAVARLLPRPVMAFSLGVLVVLMRWYLDVWRPENVVWHLSWWLLLALYVTLSGMAVSGL